MIEGIDVSYYQTITDWSAIVKTKRFAIIRSGDGNWPDPQMSRFLRDAHKAGMVVDLYHYLRFAHTPETQSNIIRHRYDARLAPIETLWLDWEDTSAQFLAMDVSARKRWMIDLVTQKDIASIPGGDYTGTWWVNTYLDGSWPQPWPKNRKRWIGQYGPWSGFFKSDPTAAGFQPVLFPGWDDWDVWQYSSSGVAPGIANLVDLDVAKEDEDMALADDVKTLQTVVTSLKRAIELEQEKDEIRADLEAWLKVYENAPEVQGIPFKVLVARHIWWRLANMGLVPTELPEALR